MAGNVNIKENIKMGKKRVAMLLAMLLTITFVFGNAVPITTIKAAENTLIIHYGGREDGDYNGWNVWVWEDGKEGKQVDFSAEDSYGKVAVCKLTQPGKVGFIVRLNDWEKKDVEEDRFVDAKNGVTEIWLTSGEKEVSTKVPDGASKYNLDEKNKARQAVYNKKKALKLNVHYYDFKKKYKKVQAYVWLEKEDGGTYDVQKKDKFGAVFQIGLMNKKKAKTAGLQITLADGSKDCESDRIIDLTQAKKNKLDVYIVQGNKEVYYNRKDATKAPVISEAYFASAKEIKFSIADTMDTSDEKLVGQFQLKDESGKSYPLTKVWSKNPGVENSASLILQKELDLGKHYTIYMKNHISSAVSVSEAFSTEAFEDAYYYAGDDLGAVYTKEKTDFRVWAPTASQVTINFYSEGTGKNHIDSQSMLQSEKGTWTYEAVGDYKNIYYTYSVTVDGITREAVDPYARTTGVNGERGMVVDLESTNPEGFDKEKRPKAIGMTDSVIYELQLRDLSVDDSSGIENKGKYLALTETGTKNSEGVSTGLDHLVDLGITHLHILPSFDFASIDESKLDKAQYNWGYDPQNYNVPEGSYSTDPTDGNVRVNEYKQMVQSLHKNGIRVVMDVVYNHTFNIEDSNFQKIVPDYYYRKNGTSYSNGSGCGNETASERAMMRKYIVDSVVYWATEYHVDGFRFDLMGVHDIETMQMVRQALDEIDSNIVIYGEGWTGGESSYDESLRAVKENMKELDGIAAFSDDFRDGLKGNVFDEKDTGFISGNNAYIEDVKLGIVGAVAHPQIDTEKLTKSEKAWANDPTQCINYVSCHDNLTLWDKLQVSVPKASKKDKIAMNKLAAAITFTSQGTPFLQAGEEFLRSKPVKNKEEKYSANSYNLPDSVNSLKWDTLSEHKDVYEYYKGLIAFRKEHKSLRMTEAKDVQDNLVFQDTSGKGSVIAYTIENSLNGEVAEEIMVVYNGNAEDVEIALPDKDTWSIYINGEKAGTEPIEEVTGSVHVDKISTVVLVKESQKSKALKVLQKTDLCIYLSIGIAVLLVLICIFFFHNNKEKGDEKDR